MKIIKTYEDIRGIKEIDTLPFNYISVIEEEFLEWFELEETGDSMSDFRMPDHSCIYLLDDKKDSTFLWDHMINIEYVERGLLKDCSYYRIGLMNDHQMNVVYSLEGTFEDKLEEWLQQREEK